MSLEEGLGVHTTKLGPGQKEEGYAMTKTRAKWFVGGICVSLALLAILAMVYASMFNDERVKNFLQRDNFSKKLGGQKAETVRLGMAIHQQEAKREHQESDTKRAFQRIASVVRKKFDETIQDSSFSESAQQDKLGELKEELASFIDHELQDWEKAAEAMDEATKKRLEKLSELQHQSLRDLLKSVSGVKMDALEDMVNDVFESGKRAPDLTAEVDMIDELEKLADRLYEGEMKFEDGLKEVRHFRSRISGAFTENLEKLFNDAKEEDLLAEALDELVDNLRLSKGKKEIAQIEEKYQAEIEKARDEMDKKAEDSNDDEEDEDDYDLEIKVNVDTLLELHKLVADGKVPVHLLDFEALDFGDLEDDDDDDDDDEDGEDGDVRYSPQDLKEMAQAKELKKKAKMAEGGN